VVYLVASVDEQLRRTYLDVNRPLLQTADPKARLAQLFERRDPLYREIADSVVLTEGRPIRQVLRDILHQLEPPQP
jgi:shikimate kinase